MHTVTARFNGTIEHTTEMLQRKKNSFEQLLELKQVTRMHQSRRGELIIIYAHKFNFVCCTSGL